MSRKIICHCFLIVLVGVAKLPSEDNAPHHARAEEPSDADIIGIIADEVEEQHNVDVRRFWVGRSNDQLEVPRISLLAAGVAGVKFEIELFPSLGFLRWRFISVTLDEPWHYKSWEPVDIQGQ